LDAHCPTPEGYAMRMPEDLTDKYFAEYVELCGKDPDPEVEE